MTGTLDFGRIYLDTQPLTQSQWPRISTGLENVFKLAHLLGVEVCIPQPVLDERRAQWQHDLDKHVGQLKSVRGEIAQLCKDLCEVPEPPGLDGKAVQAAYQKRVQELLEKYKIVIAPTTSRSTEVLYQLALARVPPFADKGTGFKDAVILFSVIEHLDRCPLEKAAILVTKDGDFDDKALEKVASGLSGRLRITRSLDEVTKALDAVLEMMMRATWELDREQARKALEAHSEAIAAFVAETVVFTERDISGFGRVLEIRALHTRMIRDVKTPLPWQRPKNEKVAFSCLVEAGLEVVQESFPFVPPRQVKVGQATEDPSGLGAFFGSGLTFGMRRENAEITKVVELECRAAVRDGEYHDLELVRAHRRDDLHSTYEMQKLLSRALGVQPAQGEADADTPE